jgi:hypothetical protein
VAWRRITLTRDIWGRNVGEVMLRTNGGSPSSDTDKGPWSEDVAPYKLSALPVK